MHSLNENLRNALAIPQDAREWLLALWNVIQVFDDMADGDPVDREALNTALCDALVNMPCNEFFLRNAHNLLPVMAVQIHKWIASDEIERAGGADAVSFAWRAGFYDVVLMVVRIVHGDALTAEIASVVRQLYGEDFGEYMKEFSHA